MKKEQALKIIFQCADKFEKNLANKNLLFVCSDKKMNISTVEVAFIRSNFLHMTGVKFNTGKRLSANEFYKMCLDRRLSLKDFDDMLYFMHDITLEHFNNYVKVNSQAEQNKIFVKTK